MSLILAQSFMKQLKRLPQKEQGVVSRTVLDLQMDPTTAALSLHRVDGNAGWWSAYANGDLRIILRREGDGRMILCWTDHHDRDYLGARNHVLSRHPVMGSMQIVEIPEVVAAQPVEKLPGAAPRPEPRVVGPSRTPLCARLGIGRGDLLGWGVPEVWVERVLAATDEDELLDVGEHHLPPEVAEADLVAGLEEIYDTERNLLYVACTRARDYLLVTSAGIPSELLLDMVAR